MKVLTASKQHICIACKTVVQTGEDYWATSFNSFCKTCGDKKVKGELVYDNSKKRYTVTSLTSAPCNFCGEGATNIIHGVPCCDNHIGNAMGGDDTYGP